MKVLSVKALALVAFMATSGCSINITLSDLPIMQKEITSFTTVVEDVNKLNAKYGSSNVLIVVDIDNTLLTSSVDLGGDIWYQWQRGKLDIKPSEDQQVACLFEDSIGLLYELSPMNLTENNLPSVIEQWQSNQNTILALTSRAPIYRAATERELIRNGMNLEVSALSPAGQDAPVYRETLERELSYMKGVMMTSGMNKGEMLDYILDKTGREFDAIVFVDDSGKNIVNVYEQFKNRSHIDRNIYHYVNIEKQREAEFGAVLTESQAIKMSNDWIELNNTLNTVFPQRDISAGCLSAN
ncbi:DUF2608 domain-containing protein [Pseudocolwellia sp. HL-MZ19]|uniref:DUF2608 domain-containing protein n=1 Tax=unclassified Pseudocolwellia TaxID=2848178 RepID=UPI003CF638EF